VNNTIHVCLRRALVWLMLLAIPFQGIASAGMVACAHAASQQPMVTMSSVPMQHDVSSGHCHDTGAPAAMHASALPDHPSSAHHQVQHQDHQDHDERCSACAACCIGAAMAGAPTIPAPPQTLSARLTDAPTGRLEAVDLALPERPPRFPLA
jgi:hypothetical protein